ncbi:Arabinanase/levansucrase/invertase [Lizonia empirigonia]|nr:Arabinanase/levansucrase/invertase [Lizonia empirigonia]
MATLRNILLVCVALTPAVWCSNRNRTYNNPVLPGWNSDPSCTFAKEWDDTFFCTTSSFLSFPGVVYASKDLINWRLASHALTRPSQLPELSNPAYIQWNDWAPKILLFTTKNPFEDDWSDPVVIENPANDIDPDIFWDDDGKIYMAVAAGIWISEINVETGAATEPFKVWNGTGDRNPESPHLYKKGGYYYLLIGEGDASGNWWAVALATRSGPAWEVYPMGRETVLVPMKWERGEWPVIDQARSMQSGPLPSLNKTVKGNGPFADEGDELNFSPRSSFPKQLLFWRPPKTSLFAISPPGHPNALRISPSRVNLTADTVYKLAEDGLGFVARKQTASTFDYSVDLSFQPCQADEEAGVTVFLTQMQHIDLSIINLDTNGSLTPHLRWRVEAIGKPNYTAPEANTVPFPKSWRAQPVRLSVEATEDSQYTFSAASVSRLEDGVSMGTARAEIVSGSSGPFTGTIIGVYATSNNGTGTTPAYFSRW